MNCDSVDGDHYILTIMWPLTWIKNAINGTFKPLKHKYNKMLDLGCGTGDHTMLLAQHFHVDEIVGIDRNEKYLEYARKNNVQNAETRYEMCDLNSDTDLQRILERNSDVDLVVSTYALHWVDDILNVLKTVSASLKGGTVEYILIWTTKIYEPTKYIMYSIPHHPKWKEYLKDVKDIPQFLTKEKSNIPSEDFLKSLTEMGYEICSERTMGMTFRFNSYEEEVGCLRWLLPFTKYIPSDLKDEFLRDCLEESRKNRNSEEKDFIKGEVFILHMKSN